MTVFVFARPQLEGVRERVASAKLSRALPLAQGLLAHRSIPEVGQRRALLNEGLHRMTGEGGMVMLLRERETSASCSMQQVSMS